MKYLFPKAIKASSKISDIDKLLLEGYLQVDIDASDSITLFDGDYFILDFGKEICGGIRILTSSFSADGSLRLRFGESLSETCAEINEESGATNDHALRDFSVKLPLLSDQSFGETGFRFVRFDFSGSFWKIQRIVAKVDMDDREEVGIFHSSDSLLNEIWDVASYTLRLNLHNGLIWDGIKRDRLCWIGDAYNEIKALECLYSEQDEIKNIIDFTKKDFLNIFTTATSIPTSYAMWWIINLLEKYRHDGDDEYLKKQIPTLKMTIEKYDSYIDMNGHINLPINFVDWPTHADEPSSEINRLKIHDEEVGVRALTYWAYGSLLTALQKMGVHDLDGELVSSLSKIEKTSFMVKHFKQVAALVTLIGKGDEKALEILEEGGAKGVSTFQSYTILSALAKAGYYDEALEIIKEYYGKMISLGATSFFEDFDVDWYENSARIDEFAEDGKVDFHATYGQYCYKKYRHSLCHGWGVGVIPYIVENIVGLKEIDATHFTFSPHLSSLNEIHYVYPSAYGKVKIDIKKNEKGLDVKIDKPDEIVIETL